MSDIEFRFVQPNEFDDWYYQFYESGLHGYNVVYQNHQWHMCHLTKGNGLTEKGLRNCLNKVTELNRTTKPKNRFGF